MRIGAARSLALSVAIAATGAGALSLAPSALAASCSDAGGVTVVVEYGAPLGTSIRCATGSPATGLDALKGAGHGYTFVPRQPGFVCTIDAKPDPCNNAPADAYWSYWHAEPGGSWSYGTTGAGSYRPVAGSIEGWSFGNGKPPGSRPPMAVATGSGAAIAGAATTDTSTPLGTQPPASGTRNLPPDGSGGLIGLATGVAIVVVLGAMTGYLALRRQRAGD
jgi:hypothetical protein